MLFFLSAKFLLIKLLLTTYHFSKNGHDNNLVQSKRIWFPALKNHSLKNYQINSKSDFVRCKVSYSLRVQINGVYLRVFGACEMTPGNTNVFYIRCLFFMILTEFKAPDIKFSHGKDEKPNIFNHFKLRGSLATYFYKCSKE